MSVQVFNLKELYCCQTDKVNLVPNFFQHSWTVLYSFPLLTNQQIVQSSNDRNDPDTRTPLLLIYQRRHRSVALAPRNDAWPFRDRTSPSRAEIRLSRTLLGRSPENAPLCCYGNGVRSSAFEPRKKSRSFDGRYAERANRRAPRVRPLRNARSRTSTSRGT